MNIKVCTFQHPHEYPDNELMSIERLKDTERWNIQDSGVQCTGYFRSIKKVQEGAKRKLT